MMTAPEETSTYEDDNAATTAQPQEQEQQPTADSPSQGEGGGVATEGGTNEPQRSGTADAETSFDHHARAIETLMPDENARDALAARVIASGGVQGVDLVSDGTPTGDFATHAAGVQGHLQGLADAEVRKIGLDPQAFYAYLQSQGPNVVRAAALETYHLGKPGSTFALHLAKFASKQRR